jgi:hypothetical protein
MTIFDLLFPLALLTLVITIGAAAFAAWRGRRERAMTLLWRTAVAISLCFAATAIVSKTSPGRVVPLGTAQRFDDWCITAVSAVRERGTDAPLRVVVPLSVKIPPQGAVTTNRLFRVPAAVHNPLLGVAHGPFPHCCIIDDPERLFHKRMVMTLQ